MATTSRYLEEPKFVRKYDIRVAAVMGDKAATFIQQVHYRAVWKEETYGTREWRSSLSEWEKDFPQWSLMTIRRVIKDCKDRGVLRIRKVPAQNNVAVYFSLNYEEIDKVGEEGTRLIEAKEVTKRADRPVQTEQVDLLKTNIRSVQDEQHQVNLSSTASSTSDNPDDSVASATESRGKVRKTLEDLQENVRRKHLEEFRTRFEKKGTSHSIEKVWEILVVDRFGRKGYMPFSVADRKNTKTHFVKFCEQAGVKLADLLEYCVNNWEVLRDHKLQALKLSDYPSYRTIYALKDRFIEQMKKNGHGEREVRKSAPRKITSIDQLPKDHPQYVGLKKVLEKGGVVTLS